MTPSAPPTKPTALAKPATFDLGTIWRAVRRRWYLALVVLITASVVAAAVYLFLPLPKHTGHVIFQIRAQPPAVLQTTSDARIDFTLYKSYQQVAIKSSVVLDPAVTEGKLADLGMFRIAGITDPAAYLASNLQIDFKLGTEFMRVYLEGDNPTDLITVLKAVSDSYISHVVNKDKSARLERLAQLKQLYEKYDAEVRVHRRKIREVQEALGGGDPVALMIKERFLEAQIGAASNQLTETITALREATVRVGLGKAGYKPGDPLPADVLADIIRTDPTYVALQKQEQETAAAIQQSLLFAQPNFKSPTVEKLERELAKVRQQLREMPEKLRPQVEEQVRQASTRTNQEKLDLDRQNITALTALQKQLELDVEELVKKKKALIGGQIDLEEIKQNIAGTEKMAEKIAGEIESIKPELDSPSRVTLSQPPDTSPGVEGNRRVKYALMAFFGIFGVGLAAITWFETRNRCIQAVEEVTYDLGLKIYGTVPRVSRGATQGTVGHNLLTESVDSTRALLLSDVHGRGAGKGRMILVSSAQSGEGKTFLSTHLGVSLAQAGLRVLLVDADMRRPTAHRVLDVKRSPGLADILGGRVGFQAVVQTFDHGLHFVPAGTWDQAARIGLSGQEWGRFATEIRSREYDIILIDSPPLLPVADGLIIAPKVDGVLIAVMHDVSRVVAVQTACQRLAAVGAKILGVVFSGVNVRGHYSYYYDSQYAAPDGGPTDQPSA
jgi:polysaccharide biosynthesis transport protein